MRVFKANEKIIVETSDGGKFEGIVSQSTPSSIKLKKVIGDGKDIYKELSFFSYEVVSASSTKEKSDKQDRVVEGSSSGDEIDPFTTTAFEKIDASDGLVTSFEAKNNASNSRDCKAYEIETTCVNKRGKAPVAVLKTVPPHLRVFPFPDRGQEQLMLTAVAREEMGEDVELDLTFLSGSELQYFLDEIPSGMSENAIPTKFAMLTDLSSTDAIVCFRHINSCSTIGISWEGVQSETVKSSSSVSLLCLTTSHLVSVLDIVAISSAAGGTLPEFLIDFLRNRSEERTFVVYDVRPLAHALLSNWNIELSSQTVDLQLFELSLSVLNTLNGRRIDGTSLMQSNSIYKIILEEFNVERQPLYVRGKYRQNDMTLWMKRPLSNVLLNTAIFQACYLVSLFHRLCQNMLKPVMKNSQKRWNLAMCNDFVSGSDLNSLISVSNPLSFWRLSSASDSAASKDSRSCQEKASQPKSCGEQNKMTYRRSLPNPSTSQPASNNVTLGNLSQIVHDKEHEHKHFSDADNFNENTNGINNGKNMSSVPCTSVLFDRSEFFDTHIAVDSYNSCVEGVEDCDEDFGTIPSKPRQYTQNLSFAGVSTEKQLSPRVCVSSSIGRHSIEEVDSAIDTSPNDSPQLLHIPVKSFGRGRGLKNILNSSPGYECF